MSEKKSIILEVPVYGLTCATCVRKVEEALLKVEGVKRASINLLTERVALSVIRNPVSALMSSGYGVKM